jgi:hypothetical protein
MCLIPAEGDAAYVRGWLSIESSKPRDQEECVIRRNAGYVERIIYTYLADDQVFRHPTEDHEIPASAVDSWFPFRIPVDNVRRIGAGG